MSVVYINGKIVKPEDAVISVYDRGFLFGDAIYEVLRSYGKILFTIEQHIDRLYKSADAIQLDIGLDKAELINTIYDFYNQHGFADAYLRIQISRGSVAKKQISLDPKNSSNANIIMYMHHLELPSAEIYKTGISLYCANVKRNTGLSMSPKIKSGNYLNNIMALLPRDPARYQDAFLLDHKGNVAEGTTFNLFMVKDGVVYTSEDESDILLGITRDIVFYCADKANIEIRKEAFKLQHLYLADEVFATSSTKEVVPVTKVDQHIISNSQIGPITKALSITYKDYISSYLEKAKKQHPWSGNA